MTESSGYVPSRAGHGIPGVVRLSDSWTLCLPYPAEPAELNRRATLIEELCGPGSDYETSKRLFPKTEDNRRVGPIKLTPSGLLSSPIDRLRRFDFAPLWLIPVVEELELAKTVLADSNQNLTVEERAAVQSLRDACRSVERKARGLEVDGCWYLYYIHEYEAAEDSPSNRAELAKAWIQGELGRANLESLKAATESLMTWVKESIDRKAAAVLMPDKPVWNSDLSELSFGGEVVRKYRATAKCCVILGCFQDDGWPEKIDNPLNPEDDLGKSVQTLNNNLSRIRFERDGSGKGIIWRRV